MRLNAEARETALSGEHARVARELHDPGDPSLAQIPDLIRDALAEMRALVFELRPSALADEGSKRYDVRPQSCRAGQVSL